MRQKAYTKKKEKEVLDLYKQGLPIKEICKITSTWKDYPTKIAKKFGIERGSGAKSKIDPNKYKLGTISSDYWIGYIISDGSIAKTNRSAIVSISTMDSEIRDKYIRYNDLCHLHVHPKNGINAMYFGSSIIVDYLISIGIIPNKSKTINLKFPLNKDILRGIFDGDGSVHNKRNCCKITTASVLLGTQIVEFLKEQGIFSKLRKRLEDCYDVWIERKLDYKLFFELLYKNRDSEVYMERKYNRFVAHLGN